MGILTKFSISISLIFFVLFFAWPIADEVSWSITKSLWADRSKVDASAAAAGSLIGVLLYGFMVLFCLWFVIKLWSRRNVLDKVEPTFTETSFSDRSTYPNRNSFASTTTTHPIETKSCPFCAEEVKFLAIKCKHCQSDISQK